MRIGSSAFCLWVRAGSFMPGFGGRAPRLRRFRVSFVLCSVWLPVFYRSRIKYAPPKFVEKNEKKKGAKSSAKSAFSRSKLPDNHPWKHGRKLRAQLMAVSRRKFPNAYIDTMLHGVHFFKARAAGRPVRGSINNINSLFNCLSDKGN